MSQTLPRASMSAEKNNSWCMASSSRPAAAFSELEAAENAGVVVRNVRISNLLAPRLQSALRWVLSVPDTSPGKYEC